MPTLTHNKCPSHQKMIFGIGDTNDIGQKIFIYFYIQIKKSYCSRPTQTIPSATHFFLSSTYFRSFFFLYLEIYLFSIISNKKENTQLTYLVKSSVFLIVGMYIFLILFFLPPWLWETTLLLLWPKQVQSPGLVCLPITIDLIC